MSMSLIPEKPLQVSPSLAATIGLEEATMLSVLADLLEHRGGKLQGGFSWLLLDENSVQRFMPFWSDVDIQRISKNLVDTGILLLNSPPYCHSKTLHFAFNEQTAAERQAPPVEQARTFTGTQNRGAENSQTRAPSPSRGANRIAPNWAPSEDQIQQICQLGIPVHFIHEQIPEFISYWSERDEPRHAWGNRFMKQVKKLWVEQQTEFSRKDQEVPMLRGWRPSQDALEILIRQAEVNSAFVEDAIPEFVLYWTETGQKSRAWNSKFIQHVRRQWARYNSALEHDTEPRRIPDNWTPGDDVYDVIKLANIDVNFARALLPEFIVYWRDSNQMHTSWNTKFLQHAKYHWARRHQLPLNQSPQSAQAAHHAGQQNTHQSSRTRDRSLVDDLTDRSWAS